MRATICCLLLAFCATGVLPHAHAAPIVFENPILTPGTTGFDSVVGTGLVTPFGTDNPDAWDYWLLAGNAGDRIQVTVNRIDFALDPVIGIWDGLEFDTTDFTFIDTDSTNRTLLAFADDEIPHPGPFGDPTAIVEFPTPALYLVAVADFGSDGNPVLPELRYQISARIIPEPASLGLVTLGTIAWLSRRRPNAA